MKNQLSMISAELSANPNTLKMVSLVVFVSLAVAGLIIPGAIAFSGPMSGDLP